MAPVYKLENWTLVERTDDDVVYVCASGEVFGHPVYGQSEEITTSPLLAHFDAIVVTASGTRYYLGKPHPEATTLPANDPFDRRDHILARSQLRNVETLGELDQVVDSAANVMQTSSPPKAKLETFLAKSALSAAHA